MSVVTRVEEWLRKMGYDGEIPPSLSKICSPSVAFIWEQLIVNARPRQEVEYKRKNIIVNRLSKKPLEQQDQFDYPIKEIRIYMEKQKLERRVEYLEKNIEEKDKIVEELLKKNDITYVSIDNLKAKIKEKKERKFLCEKKSELIKRDIQQAQESLTLAKNLTPVEMDANPNREEITKTLQKCAEKLQKLSEGISLPKVHTSRSSSISVKQTPKYSSKMNTFSQYLNQSTTLMDIAPSTRKKSNKENINLLQSQTISKCLKFTGDDIDNDKKKTENKNKRESLGLLSDKCLCTSDELDSFLLSPEHPFLQPFSDSTFTDSSAGINDVTEKLCNDKSVKELLKNLLHENNRYLIVTHCKNIYQQLVREIRTSIIECNKLKRLERGINQNDVSQLYLIHVKGELEKEKCRIILKKLNENVKRKKEEILFQLCNKVRNNEIKNLFELQIKDAYVTGANSFLHKEINATQKIENDNEQQVINLKIKRAKEEIISKNNDIQALLKAAQKILQDIRTNREETSLYVKKLAPYIYHLEWTEAMAEETHSQEVQIFKEFPLEYNRKFKYNHSQTMYNSISDTKLPSYIKTDSDNLEMVTALFKEPFTSAENIIYDLLRTKIVSNKLKPVESQVEFENDANTCYTPEELYRREVYVDSVVNKLNSIINSSSVKEILSAPSDMKEITDMWVEMSFKNFISDKRQVDGHGYKFYEKILEDLRSS